MASDDPAKKVETNCQILQFHILNNIDLLIRERSSDPKKWDTFVKGPLMRAITNIREGAAALSGKTKE